MRVFAALACLCSAIPAFAASAWTVADAMGKPGETVQVEVRFSNPGGAAAAIGTFYVSDPELRLRLPPVGQALSGGPNASCRVKFEQLVEIVILPPASGEVVVCRVPVTVSTIAERDVEWMRVSGTCSDANNQPVTCDGMHGYFTIDGPAPWWERALVVVPKLPPAGPTRDALVAFDYAGNAPAPLRMFDALRPRAVESAFAPFPYPPSIYSKADTPNAAVAGLLRAVRVIYKNEQEHTAALQGAGSDPAVEGVLSSRLWYGPRTYPAQPRANEPFALWTTEWMCTSLGSEGYDARQVTVVGDQIIVEVPPGSWVTWITCPGGELDFLWNMPGLPAGEYTLRLGAKGTPLQSSEGWYSMPLTVVAQSSALGFTRPETISVSNTWVQALLGLLLAVLGAAWLRQR